MVQKRMAFLLALGLVVGAAAMLASMSHAQTTVSWNRRYAPLNGDPDDTQGGDTSEGVTRSWSMTPRQEEAAVDRSRFRAWIHVALPGARGFWFRF